MIFPWFCYGFLVFPYGSHTSQLFLALQSRQVTCSADSHSPIREKQRITTFTATGDSGWKDAICAAKRLCHVFFGSYGGGGILMICLWYPKYIFFGGTFKYWFGLFNFCWGPYISFVVVLILWSKFHHLWSHLVTIYRTRSMLELAWNRQVGSHQFFARQ